MDSFASCRTYSVLVVISIVLRCLDRQHWYNLVTDSFAVDPYELQIDLCNERHVQLSRWPFSFSFFWGEREGFFVVVANFCILSAADTKPHVLCDSPWQCCCVSAELYWCDGGTREEVHPLPIQQTHVYSCACGREDQPQTGQSICQQWSFSSSSAFPARSMGFTIFSEIFACDPFFVCVFFFYPAMEIATFRLCGMCMLGVLLLLAFIHLGHECQDLLSQCDGMHVCTDWTLVYTLMR